MLNINNLTVHFHDHKKGKNVVEGISFSMSEGEILGIVGESGSGKTVTSLTIAGLLNRYIADLSGELIFNGEDMVKYSAKDKRRIRGRDIGFVFQEPMTALNPVMKIGRQVEESLFIHENLTKEERKKKAISAIYEVELNNPEEVYNKYPHELSGGQLQRICIAAAIITRPKLLIADEPTTALDVTIQAQIIELLKRLNKENNMGIIFISHNLKVVKKLCNRVIVMKDGSIVEEGICEEIFKSPKEDYTKKLIDSIPTRRRKL